MGSLHIRTHCLVLDAPERTTEYRMLQQQATDRGWSLRTVHDPCLALADLCLRERMTRMREADGFEAIERHVLLIVEPAQIPDRDAFLDAVRRYSPRTPIWSMADGDITPMSLAAPPIESAPIAPPSPPSVVPPPSTHALRLTHHDEDVVEDHLDDDDLTDASRTTITPEEYDMLFRPDVPEGDG
ncbi:MAG: hypothetical protein AAF432_01345 [Planctomycetota bacterium]